MADIEMTPITRKEFYLAGITGMDVQTPSPVTRLESYLNDILNGTVSQLTPLNRVECYLAKISGADVTIPVPMTRLEVYLAAIAGMDIDVPDPVTREEHWLWQWANAGPGGVVETITGTLPLVLQNAINHAIVSLTRYGLCTQAATPTPNAPVDIMCNNGALRMVDDELPTGYKRVLGFTCNNNAMWEIDGFRLKGSDTVRISFSVNAACNVFGCYQGADATDNYDLYVSTTSGSKYFRYGNGTYLSYWSSADLGKRFDVVYTPNGSQGMPQDSTWTPKTFTSENNLLIGSTTLTGTSSKLKGDLYGSIVVDGRLKLIPCERVSDNVLGYYDTYTNTFYEPYTGFDGAVSLGYDGSHYQLSVVGTPEVLTVHGANLITSTLTGYGTYVSPTQAAGTRAYKWLKDLPNGTYQIGVEGDYELIVQWRDPADPADGVAQYYENLSGWITSGEVTLNKSTGGYGIAVRRTVGTSSITPANFDGTLFCYKVSDIQTASVPMLLSVGDYADEAELISGIKTGKVGVYVFTGDETFGTSTAYGKCVLWNKQNHRLAANYDVAPLCTHYSGLASPSGVQAENTCFFNATGHFYFRAADNDTTAFKADLAAKYASGNPVILLYALATATTEQTTAQHLVTHEGANTVDSVANVGPLEAKVEYMARVA